MGAVEYASMPHLIFGAKEKRPMERTTCNHDSEDLDMWVCLTDLFDQ